MRIPDYKIKSKGVLKSTLITIISIIFLLMVAELTIDLAATTIEIITILFFIILLLGTLSFFYPENTNLRHSIVIYAFIAFEIHFARSMYSYHIVIFWISILPLLALLIAGLRLSFIWLGITLITNIFNTYYVYSNHGSSYSTDIQLLAYGVSGTIFCLAFIAISFLLYTMLGNAYKKSLEINETLNELRTNVEDKKILLENYQQSIINLSKNEAVFEQSDNELYKAICNEAAKHLNIDRVSIWFLKKNDSIMERKYIHDSLNESDEVAVLNRDDFPNYFNSVLEKPFIIANDAKTHIDTKEFKDNYLTPLQIESMLDCAIKVGTSTVGVICCENKYELKKWNPEDALYVQSLSDLIALNQKSYRIKSLLEEINEKNIEVGAVNEELRTLNESLEETVKNRTSELESQNEQLTEYAFINSHLLRAPLSRVLGLSHLIAREVKTPNDKELMESLIKSTNELDTVVRRISDILYEGNPNKISRKDINEIIKGT